MDGIENLYEDIGGEAPKILYCCDFNGIHPNPFHIHIYLPVNGDRVGLRDKTPPEMRWAFFCDSLV